MAALKLICAFILFISGTSSNKVRFDGHHLFRATISSAEALIQFKDMVDENGIDFWNDPYDTGINITVRASPSKSKKLIQDFEKFNVSYNTLTTNLQDWIDHERNDNQRDALTVRDGDFSVDMYHPLEEIHRFLEKTHEKYPTITRTLTIGRSIEDRPIRGIKISTGGNYTRPAVWIDGGIHAREWIAPASAVFLINKLINGYKEDPEITVLLNTFDFYIIPVVNPDGYVYSWSTNRLWRKNRRRNPGSICRGVDINRNFDAGFGLRGSSPNPCAENFGGASAFSEKETKAISEALSKLKRRLKVYINLHSYSQIVMIPYGYTRSYSTDHDRQKKALKEFALGIMSENQATYRYGTASETLYLTAGAAIDWAYDACGIVYSYVVELRDRGFYGFILPREYIVPTGNELFRGIHRLLFYITSAKNGASVNIP